MDIEYTDCTGGFLKGKNRVLGELLYIGLRYEKSRPWKRKFKKEQTEHIVLLREILMAMMEGEVSKNDTLVIENLWKLIHKRKDLKKQYRFTEDVRKKFSKKEYTLITFVDDSFLQPEINELMLCLLNEVIENLSLFFVDKKRVKKLLQALHNLPRVYLTQNLPTLCDRKEARLNPELAMKYAEDNMDDSMKEKYKNFFH